MSDEAGTAPPTTLPCVTITREANGHVKVQSNVTWALGSWLCRIGGQLLDQQGLPPPPTLVTSKGNGSLRRFLQELKP